MVELLRQLVVVVLGDPLVVPELLLRLELILPHRVQVGGVCLVGGVQAGHLHVFQLVGEDQVVRERLRRLRVAGLGLVVRQGGEDVLQVVVVPLHGHQDPVQDPAHLHPGPLSRRQVPEVGHPGLPGSLRSEAGRGLQLTPVPGGALAPEVEPVHLTVEDQGLRPLDRRLDVVLHVLGDFLRSQGPLLEPHRVLVESRALHPLRHLVDHRVGHVEVVLHGQVDPNRRDPDVTRLQAGGKAGRDLPHVSLPRPVQGELQSLRQPRDPQRILRGRVLPFLNLSG